MDNTIPYYFSVDKYDWNEGVVTFSMLCCSPSPTMKVGVAGNLIITTEKSVEELKSWLNKWNITIEKEIKEKFSTREEAQLFHKKLRSRFTGGREEAGERVKVKLKEYHENFGNISVLHIGA
ncbi:MAG: hypothetical protein HY773_00280 [Candidatus Terrybacteria bacterium]|nr:hypothetical protein [Candidatus Terrybacteria bacterium]